MCQADNGRAPKLDKCWECKEMWLFQTARSAGAFPASSKPPQMIPWPLIRTLEQHYLLSCRLREVKKKDERKAPCKWIQQM